jgi:mannan endo-1,4-beta-mannosidase
MTQLSGTRSTDGMVSRVSGIVALAYLALSCSPTTKALEAKAPAPPRDLERVASTSEVGPSPYFVVDGRPFCFQGTNNYYLNFQSPEAAIRVLDAARDLNFDVIRTWAFNDRGSLDGSLRNVHEGSAREGVYFQVWDKERGVPVYNDSETGLKRLDFVVHSARERGLRLVLVLTNSWRDYGGMDQYLVWHGLNTHHQFFTDARVRATYKSWVHQLVTRINSVDGVAYRDDPAIFAWELANEPRTMTLEDFDSADGWDGSTITRWAEEMSAYIQELDSNHMVSVGDEGFLSSGGDGWTYNAPFGVDSEALTMLPGIDFGTYHLYPDHWVTSDEWGKSWILSHIELARRANKPTLLEEYGTRVRREREHEGKITSGGARRLSALSSWNDVLLEKGGSGALFWMLGADVEPSRRYPDYDRFTLYPGEESVQLLSQYAVRMRQESVACAHPAAQDFGPPSPFVRAQGVK